MSARPQTAIITVLATQSTSQSEVAIDPAGCVFRCNNLTDEADVNCQPEPEICDNSVDDNGDGLIDCAEPLCEGFVGQPGSRNTGLPGVCMEGTLTCDGTAIDPVCVQNTESGVERFPLFLCRN